MPMRRTQPARRAPRRLGAVALVLGAFAAPLARADGEGDPLENLAEALVAKRSDVERLAGEVELEKAARRDALRSLAQRRADLERQLQAAEVELDEARVAAAESATELERSEAAGRALTPVVERTLAGLRSHVRDGLPFRTADRLADLDAIEAELDAGRLAPDEALGRLWSTLEDELRLTRENGLYRQRVELEGEARLVDVARLGTVLLYLRTPDGRHGVFEPAGDGWRPRLLEGAEAARVAALFEALERHVRQGFFVLPDPYAGQPAGGVR